MLKVEFIRILMQSTLKDLVSIILPVYNGEKYLYDAIDSVLTQSYEHWELLVVNDGSADGSLQIATSFQDERIKVFDQENRGVSAARNVGLSKMQGDFFCFLDADDMLTTNSIQSRMEAFRLNSSVCFVDGSVEICNDSLSEVLKVKIHTFNGNPQQALCSLDESCFFGPTWMIRKERNKQYWFREGLTHGEDLLFYISISSSGLYTGVQETIYIYRKGHESAMGNIKAIGKGYRLIGEILPSINGVKEAWVREYRRKSRSIMLKTYLVNGYLIEACKTVFHR